MAEWLDCVVHPEAHVSVDGTALVMEHEDWSLRDIGYAASLLTREQSEVIRYIVVPGERGRGQQYRSMVTYLRRAGGLPNLIKGELK
jgi:hypothetical protein